MNMDEYLFNPPHPNPLPPRERDKKGNPLNPPSQGELLEAKLKSSITVSGFMGNDPFPLGVARRRKTFAGKFRIFIRSNHVDDATRYGQLPSRLVM